MQPCSLLILAATSEEPSLLAVVLDTNPLGWARISPEDSAEGFTTALRHLLVFLNAFSALDTRNQLLVIAAHPGNSLVLYDSSKPTPVMPADPDTVMAEADDSAPSGDCIYPRFSAMDKAIWTRIQQLFAESQANGLPQNSAGHTPGPAIAGALSMVLCYMNRRRKQDTAVRWQPRILMLSASDDVPSQYTPLMNCIFSAQRSSVPVDVCKLNQGPGVFLRQASHITGGLHLTIERPRALLQYLLNAFLSDASLRRDLCMPDREDVDFRAACFCHRHIINIGYVCSVCLSIFCSAMDVCSTCHTRFSTKPIPVSQSDPPISA